MPSRVAYFQAAIAASVFAVALPGVRTAGQREPYDVGSADATSVSPLGRGGESHALDAAVAAALLAATREQFAVPLIELKLDSAKIETASPRDREVSGSGRLSLDIVEGEWLPFRYKVLYDTETAVASAPRITLDTIGAAQPIARTSPLGRGLAAQAESAIALEFEGQSVRLRLERIDASDMGRYRHVTANGSVDFGQGGDAIVAIDALYDPAKMRWIRVRHELGASVPTIGLRVSPSPVP